MAEHFLTQWVANREQLPKCLPLQYCSRVVIAKLDGGQRELSIPTVTDRLIRLVLLQVLQPLLDPTFNEHRHGFRPGRCAQEPIWRPSGERRVVVDVDLVKFFDPVEYNV